MTREFTKDEVEFIGRQKVVRFNSITPDGHIHSVPLCFAFDGRNFYFHSRKTNRKRWRNIKADDNVSLELDVYTDDWSGNMGILMYGKAKFLDSGPAREAGLSLLRKKYSQYGELPDATGMVSFVPSRIISWHH